MNIAEYENKPVKNTLAGQGLCIHCDAYSIGATINFMDGTSIFICGVQFLMFKQRRKPK